MNTGVHLCLKLKDCQSHLSWQDSIVPTLLQELKKHPIQVLKYDYHEFEGGGYTMYFLLAESHISIHTWPELKQVYADVFVCNYSNDNTDCTQSLQSYLLSFFGCTDFEAQAIER